MTERLVITALAAQKRNPSRCSVFINGEFAFGCEADVALEYKLAKGKEITRDELEKLQAREDQMRLKQAAYRYLAYKPRTREQVRRAMLAKGYAPEEALYAADFFQELGYLDDLEYARMFVRDALKFKPAGAAKLRAELKKRGVAEADVETALSEVFALAPEGARASELEQAERAARKKWRSYVRKTTEQRRQALVGYLRRQGFGWETAREVLKILESDLETNEFEDDSL